MYIENHGLLTSGIGGPKWCGCAAVTLGVSTVSGAIVINTP